MNTGSNGKKKRTPRPHIGVLFECCHVYRRIYKNRDGTCYTGICPRCNKRITFKIGPGGTNQRMFRAQ